MAAHKKAAALTLRAPADAGTPDGPLEQAKTFLSADFNASSSPRCLQHDLCEQRE